MPQTQQTNKTLVKNSKKLARLADIKATCFSFDVNVTAEEV